MRGKERLPKAKALSILPEHLVFVEILPRLPVKSLMRFKCVSKSWLTRISHDSSFVDAHFLNYQPSNPLAIVVGHVKRRINTRPQKAWVLSEKLDNMRELDVSKVSAAKNHFSIIGSCNGLVCLTTRYSIMLWNPATRHVRKLSDTPLQSEIIWIGSGFGFDSAKRDFKVVLLTLKGWEDEPVVCAQVLDRRGGVWRNCCDEKRGLPVEGGLLEIKYAVEVDGILYWAAHWEYRCRILSFDLRNETLRMEDGPNGKYEALYLWSGLLVAYTKGDDGTMMWAATPLDGGLHWREVMELEKFPGEIWMDKLKVMRIAEADRNDELFVEDFNVVNHFRWRHLRLLCKVDTIFNYVETIVPVF